MRLSSPDRNPAEVWWRTSEWLQAARIEPIYPQQRPVSPDLPPEAVPMLPVRPLERRRIAHAACDLDNLVAWFWLRIPSSAIRHDGLVLAGWDDREGGLPLVMASVNEFFPGARSGALDQDEGSDRSIDRLLGSV